jgi:hypothetical protein
MRGTVSTVMYATGSSNLKGRGREQLLPKLFPGNPQIVKEW